MSRLRSGVVVVHVAGDCSAAGDVWLVATGRGPGRITDCCCCQHHMLQIQAIHIREELGAVLLMVG